MSECITPKTICIHPFTRSSQGYISTVSIYNCLYSIDERIILYSPTIHRISSWIRNIQNHFFTAILMWHLKCLRILVCKHQETMKKMFLHYSKFIIYWSICTSFVIWYHRIFIIKFVHEEGYLKRFALCFQ